MDTFNTFDASERRRPLTQNEYQIIVGLGSGKKVKEIALEKEVSVGAIKSSLNNILYKTDSDTVSEAVAKLVWDIISSSAAQVDTDTITTHKITEKQCEVLALIAAGKMYKQIAYELGVTEGAIKQRVKGAISALGVKSKNHALVIAKLHNYI